MNNAANIYDTVLNAFLPKNLLLTNLSQLTGGEVNQSWHVATKKGDFVLRRLNKVFDDRLINDVDRVTKELADRGWEQPTLCTARDGLPYHKDVVDREVLWTLGTFVPADTTTPQASTQPYEHYGALLGRLHNDLAAIHYRPRYVLPHYRDTVYHLRMLRRYCTKLPDGAARTLAEKILEAYDALPRMPKSRRQLIHGDPRTANMLFRDGRPFTFIDWDTLMWGSVWMDIGDLIRSLVEDAAVHYYLCSAADIAAFCTGYHRANAIAAHPRSFMDAALVAAKYITLELAARYLNDIVEDYYWVWDQGRYDSRAESNLQRAEETMHVYARINDLTVEKNYGY